MAKKRKERTRTFLLILSFILALFVGALFYFILGGFDWVKILIAFGASFIILSIISLILSSNKMKGVLGEYRVSRRLNKLASRYEGKVFNDVIIPGDNNRTSQIDHILITPYGVYVIETKNVAGKIYGKEDDQYWTQSLAFGRTKNKLYNPVKQNFTHIYRLKELLETKVHLESIVVFINADISDVDSEAVYTLKELKRLISKKSEKKYTSKQVEAVYQEIKEYKDNPVTSSRGHIKEIKDMQRAVEHNICPRCGGKLITRTNEEGKEFLGCENYPKCKFIKKD